MNKHRGFTLLEVLLAIVLLALVVGVCTPYLRAGEARNDPAGLSAFIVAVNEAIEQAQRQEPRVLNVRRLEEIAADHGWRCEPAEPTDTDGLDGRWLCLSDGRYSVCRWGRVETEVRP